LHHNFWNLFAVTCRYVSRHLNLKKHVSPR
jgi:hypothetical protein